MFIDGSGYSCSQKFLIVCLIDGVIDHLVGALLDVHLLMICGEMTRIS